MFTFINWLILYALEYIFKGKRIIFILLKSMFFPSSLFSYTLYYQYVPWLFSPLKKKRAIHTSLYALKSSYCILLGFTWILLWSLPLILRWRWSWYNLCSSNLWRVVKELRLWKFLQGHFLLLVSSLCLVKLPCHRPFLSNRFIEIEFINHTIHLFNVYYSMFQYIPKWSEVSCVWLFATAWTVAYKALHPCDFSRQEYWSGLPFPSPADLPVPGIELGSPAL